MPGEWIENQPVIFRTAELEFGVPPEQFLAKVKSEPIFLSQLKHNEAFMPA